MNTPARGRSLSRDDIVRARAAIVQKYGEWTVERIDLGHGVMTGGSGGQGIWNRMHSSTQAIYDVMGRTEDLRGVTVLDLGSLEGLIPIEFARHGATVITVEGRTINIEKARFAASCLGLSNITFVQGDAVDIDPTQLSNVDIVHCAGLLYHLTAERALSLLLKIGQIAKRACVIETCYSVEASEVVTHDGVDYYGKTFQEFPEHTDESTKKVAAWSALSEDRVFFFTGPSLVNAIHASGFSSVYTTVHPHVHPALNRSAFLGIKGRTQRVLTGDDEFKALQEILVPEYENVEFTCPSKAPVKIPVKPN